ncbi:MAG: glycosyltransferase, partial [Verrucomicrobiae bacterium]|nr:glycosyltransferase [Verrucomicrobiae bacterium]
MALRIIHVVETLAKSAGGLPVAVTELADATAGQAETWIVAPPPGSDEVPLPESIQRFPDLGALKAALAAAPPKDTILHQHGLWSPLPVRSGRLAEALGMPLLISPHGMLEPWALAHHGWRKRLAWLAYQRANLNAAAALHATADSEAAQFQALGLRPPVAVLPLGVRPIPEMPLDPPSVAAPKMQRQALFLSRLHPKKGLDRLLQAWAQVRPEGWELIVAGPDETGHRAEMERLADHLAVAD